MKITFKVSADDYVEALRADRLSKRISRWNFRIMTGWLAIVVVGTIVVMIVIPEMRRLVWPAIPIAGIYLYLLHGGYLRRQQYEKIQSLKTENVLEISEDGITTSTAAARSELKWVCFIGYHEDKNLFLLYQQPRLFNIVPKRAFAPGEMGQFRELLKRKIPVQS